MQISYLAGASLCGVGLVLTLLSGNPLALTLVLAGVGAVAFSMYRRRA